MATIAYVDVSQLLVPRNGGTRNHTRQLSQNVARQSRMHAHPVRKQIRGSQPFAREGSGSPGRRRCQLSHARPRAGVRVTGHQPASPASRSVPVSHDQAVAPLGLHTADVAARTSDAGIPCTPDAMSDRARLLWQGSAIACWTVSTARRCYAAAGRVVGCVHIADKPGANTPVASNLQSIMSADCGDSLLPCVYH